MPVAWGSAHWCLNFGVFSCVPQLIYAAFADGLFLGSFFKRCSISGWMFIVVWEIWWWWKVTLNTGSWSTKVRRDLALMKRNVTPEPHRVTFVNRPQIDGDFSTGTDSWVVSPEKYTTTSEYCIKIGKFPILFLINIYSSGVFVAPILM